MVSGQRVLLIDGLSETEQVLKAVLEPRGLRVDRIRSAAPQPPLSDPAVVVLHDECEGNTGLDGVPRVIIGAASIPDGDTGDDSHYLPHPFQYRELIQAIERLLTPGRNNAPAA